jgi:hypothetical protein
MRARLQILDHTALGASRGILPTKGLRFSVEVGGGGGITLQALKRDLDNLSAWDSVARLELQTGAEEWTPLGLYALRAPWSRPVVGGIGDPATWADADVTWGDPDVTWAGITPEQGIQLVDLSGVALLEQWASETVVLPEYVVDAMPRGAGDERGLGWMSTVYNPATDPNEPWDKLLVTSRTTFPDGWPAGCPAEWITASNATDLTERKFFRGSITVPGSGPQLVRVFLTSDESCTLWIAAEPVLETSSTENGKEEFSTIDMVMWPGSYAICADTTHHVTKGGDGVDPIAVGVALLDGDGAITSWIAQTDDSWVACRRDDQPPNNQPPGPTPAAIIRYLIEEAQERNATGWQGVTLSFTDTTDSYDQPWAQIVGERQVRYGHDSYWAVFNMLAEAGELDLWLTPDLVLHAAPHQGTTKPITLTEADLPTVGDRRGPDPGSWAVALTHEGWVYGQQSGPRREYALELGTAISASVGARVVSASLAESGRWDAGAELLPRAGRIPGVDYAPGDTLTLTYKDLNQSVRVLSLSAEAGEGALLWSVELTEGAR